MWYIGTKTACEAYNERVTLGLGFTGSVTANWSNVRRHPAKSLFAIIAHPGYLDESLELVEELPEDWFLTEEDYEQLG